MRKLLASLGALGALVALLVALVVISMISAGSPAAPPTTTADEAGATARTSRDVADATASLKDVDGNVVGVVRFDAHTGGGGVGVEAEVNNVAPAGQFHGFHLHTTGECDPNAVDPETGEKVPFFSAGGHLELDSDIHGEHAGDFPVLPVNSGGRAEVKFETDRFEPSQLFDRDGSAVIIHAGPDNYANIPPTTPDGEKRYHSHPEDVFGADSLSKATGDGGDRFACGVVHRT
jgi:Cu-Zn family superoxide dismutase